MEMTVTYATLIDALVDEWTKPVTITEAARLLTIPGATPAAAAQKLRRLERDGQLPAAHRSLAHADRYWYRGELVAIREALHAA